MALAMLSGSCGSGRIIKRGNRDLKRKPMSSYVPGVMRKLRKMSQFKTAEDNQVRHEAEDLSNPVRIVERYFSSITYHLYHEKFKEMNKDLDKDLTSTLEKRLHTLKSIKRVEEVAHFQVKLLLRYVDSRRMQPEVVGRIAAALHMEYGPLHAFLLINDEILVQWNDSSVIIPEIVNPETDIVKLAEARVQDLIPIQRQLSGPYHSYSEVELVFDAASQKLDLINKLAGVIAKYNNNFTYDLIFRNCQTFVIDALTELGCKKKPQFGGKMQEYFTHLRTKGKPMVEFETHEQLDDYIEKHIADLSTDNMEYFLAQYFLFHTNDMLREGVPEAWQCHRIKCMVDFLEIKISEKSLLMPRFLRFQHEHHRHTLNA